MLIVRKVEWKKAEEYDRTPTRAHQLSLIDDDVNGSYSWAISKIDLERMQMGFMDPSDPQKRTWANSSGERNRKTRQRVHIFEHRALCLSRVFARFRALLKKSIRDRLDTMGEKKSTYCSRRIGILAIYGWSTFWFHPIPVCDIKRKNLLRVRYHTLESS